MGLDGRAVEGEAGGGVAVGFEAGETGERGGRKLGWEGKGEHAGGVKKGGEGGDFGGVEMIVRRVGEDEIKGGGVRGGALSGVRGCVGGRICGAVSGEGGDGGLDNLGVGEASNGEDGTEVLAESADDGGGLLYKNHTGGAATQGFQAEGAGAGVGVQHRGAGEVGLEHIEESEFFAGTHGVGGGAGGGGEGATLVGAGEDAEGGGVSGFSGHGER